MMPTVPETEIARARNQAIRLLEYATDGSKSRSTSDSIYLEIVEGRFGVHYSSCGDLAHWLLYRMGVRADWVNRREHNGWIVGANLNRFYAPPIGPNEIARRPDAATFLAELNAGDILIVNGRFGLHAICVEIVDEDQIITAEYGQANIGIAGKQLQHSVLARDGGELGSVFVRTEHADGSYTAAQCVQWVSLADAIALDGRADVSWPRDCMPLE